MIQILSLLGAALVLSAYGAGHYGILRPDGLTAGLLNFIGAALVASTAIQPWNAGVFVLEATWAALSLGVIARALRRRGAAPERPHGAA